MRILALVVLVVGLLPGAGANPTATVQVPTLMLYLSTDGMGPLDKCVTLENSPPGVVVHDCPEPPSEAQARSAPEPLRVCVGAWVEGATLINSCVDTFP